jgi:hypothetical protein
MLEVSARARIDIGCEGTIVGGRSAVVPIPMKIPTDRYLNSVYITFAGLKCITDIPFDVDNPYVLGGFQRY